MPSLADKFTGDARLHLLQQMGREILYAASDAEDPQPITAVVGDVRTDLLQDEDGHTRYHQRIVQLSTADGEGGVSTPRRGATLLIDAETWTVRIVASVAGSIAKLLCVRTVLDESAVAGNRRGLPGMGGVRR